MHGWIRQSLAAAEIRWIDQSLATTEIQVDAVIQADVGANVCSARAPLSVLEIRTGLLFKLSCEQTAQAKNHRAELRRSKVRFLQLQVEQQFQLPQIQGTQLVQLNRLQRQQRGKLW